ncbi:MAG TPA: hypothetical protein VL172_15390, partial [Kofleriaceae bacterium]|nr:hypothetical protein [Kofleriaceae bacterium]
VEGVRRMGEGRYEIEKKVWEGWMKEPTAMTKGMKLSGAKRGEEYYGFKVDAIEKGALGAGLGLRVGDVITDLGGTAMTNPIAAYAAVKRIADKADVTLTVEREGKAVVVTYSIR